MERGRRPIVPVPPTPSGAKIGRRLKALADQLKMLAEKMAAMSVIIEAAVLWLLRTVDLLLHGLQSICGHWLLLSS